MTDLHHPITPSIELVKQWSDRWHSAKDNDFDVVLFVAIEAARWGADQELEACCEWFVRDWTDIETADTLRAARRPEPQTLNSIALQMLGTIERDAHYLPEITDTIRRALEQLND